MVRNTASLVVLGIACIFALLTPEFLIGKFEVDAVNQDTGRTVQVSTKLYAVSKQTKTYVGSIKHGKSDGISYSRFHEDVLAKRCADETSSVCNKDGTYSKLRTAVLVLLITHLAWKAAYHKQHPDTATTENGMFGTMSGVYVIDIAIGVVWFILASYMFDLVSREMSNSNFQGLDCQAFVDKYTADLDVEFKSSNGWSCIAGTFERKYYIGYWVHVALIVVSVFYTVMTLANQFVATKESSVTPLTLPQRMEAARDMVVKHWEVFAAAAFMLIATVLYASVVQNPVVVEWTFSDSRAAANQTGCAGTFAARLTDDGVFDVFNTANEYESGSLLAEIARADAAKQVIPSLAAAFLTTTYDYQRLTSDAITVNEQMKSDDAGDALPIDEYSGVFKRSIAKMLYTQTAARQSTDSIIKEQGTGYKAAHAPAFHSGTIQQGLGPAYMFENPRHGTGFVLTIPVDLKPASDASPKIDMDKQQNFEHPCENRPFDDNFIDLTGSTTAAPKAAGADDVKPWQCDCTPAGDAGVVCVYNINVVGKENRKFNAGRNSRVTLRWISRAAITAYEALAAIEGEGAKTLEAQQAEGPQPQSSESDFAQSHLWAVAAQMIACNINGTVIQSDDSLIGTEGSFDTENDCGLSGRIGADTNEDGNPDTFTNSNTNIGVMAFKKAPATKLPSPAMVEFAVHRAIDATVAGDNFVTSEGKTKFGCSSKPAGGAILNVNMCTESNKELKDDKQFPQCLRKACDLGTHNLNNIWVVVFLFANVVLLICSASYHEHMKASGNMDPLMKYGPLVCSSIVGIVAFIFLWAVYYADYNVDFGLKQCMKNDKFYAHAATSMGVKSFPPNEDMTTDETDENKSNSRKLQLLFSAIFATASVICHVVAIVRQNVAQKRGEVDE